MLFTPTDSATFSSTPAETPLIFFAKKKNSFREFLYLFSNAEECRRRSSVRTTKLTQHVISVVNKLF